MEIDYDVKIEKTGFFSKVHKMDSKPYFTPEEHKKVKECLSQQPSRIDTVMYKSALDFVKFYSPNLSSSEVNEITVEHLLNGILLEMDGVDNEVMDELKMLISDMYEKLFRFVYKHV